MGHKNDISILVVTHNHGQYIEKLIESFERFGYGNVYFCDAASSDNTLSLLQNSSFREHVLAKTNLEGFSKNNNDLIRHFNLHTPYYLLVNPDLYFEEDFIAKLYAHIIQDEKTGIVAPKVLYPNGELQTTWKKFPSIWHVAKKRLGILKANKEIQQENGIIDWCLGACMLISNRFLKKDNALLDERYRLYCEDVDICFEARTRNLQVIGYNDAQVFHHLNELSSKNIFSKYNYWNIQSILKFAFKWNFRYLFRKRFNQ